MGPEEDSVKAKWIAEQVVSKFSPNAKIVYGKKQRGWLGMFQDFPTKQKS